MKQKITVLVGAQFGSEGKGAVAYAIANDYDIHVRTGGPNAGHTILHEGVEYKMQCIPCGWTNPEAKLVIGAGAVINPEILRREINMIHDAGYGLNTRLFIDPAATIIDPRHVEEEGHTTGDIHKRIGSTGEGVGAARRAFIHRDTSKARQFREIAGEFVDSVSVIDTAMYMFGGIRLGKSVLLEGTQGCGLSLTHGNWPYVTSADTNAAQFCADAGIPPHVVTDVILVARTYPIRVAGNSGPLAEETNWDTLSEKIGKQIEERTTVTKLVRRVGEWDEALMDRACTVNCPTEVAITFLDYLSPEDEGVTEYAKLSERSRSFIDYVERRFNVRVSMAGTGYDPKGKGWTYVKR